MASEVELKLEVPPAEIDGIVDLPWLRALANGPVSREKLVTVYFDTAKRTLREQGLSLRVRHVGKRRLQTIKTLGKSDRGAFGRDEWEAEIARDRPDLRLAEGTALASVVTKKLKRKLKPIFETAVQRTVLPLRCDGGDVELAIDRGQIRTGGRREPISEIEIELKSGDPAALATLAERFARSVSVGYGARAKSERGYALSAGELGRPVYPEPIVIDAAATTAEAFTAIGLSCLKQIVSNREAVRGGDAEGIHQMRVGLRRLRAAISVFKKLLRGAETDAIKAELEWLTDRLGPARELDVLIEERVRPLRKAEPGTAGMRALKRDLEAKRRRGVDQAKAAVDSERCRRLGLQTALWLAHGTWLRSDDALAIARRDRPAADFAAEALAKRTRKIGKKIRKIEALTARRRHKLRIAVKKLRYATEFFAGLFPKRKRDTRRKRIAKILKSLQESLGTLNDIEAHRQLAKPVVRSGETVRQKAEKAFAMGFITGQEQRQVVACLSAARKAGRRLAAAPGFWRS